MANITGCAGASTCTKKILRNGAVVQLQYYAPDPCFPNDTTKQILSWGSLTSNSTVFTNSIETTDKVCTSDPCQGIPSEQTSTLELKTNILTVKSPLLAYLVYGNGADLEITLQGSDINATEVFEITCKMPCSKYNIATQTYSTEYYVDLCELDYVNISNGIYAPRDVVITNVTTNTVVDCADYYWSMADLYPRIVFKDGVVAEGDTISVEYTYRRGDVCFAMGGRRLAPQSKVRIIEYTAGKSFADTDTCYIIELNCADILPSGDISLRDDCSTDTIEGVEITMSSKSGKWCYLTRAQ
jgi:hypothetical protein